MLGDVIKAAFAFPLLPPGTKEPKQVIQYLPRGKHEITAKVNGETATREVIVEAGVERLFQEGLEAHLAENVIPFIDYLHEGGRASGHPKQFAWDDERGLTLEVDWTPMGSTTIASRELQFFSPEFLLSPEGKPLGLHPVNKAIGGLVSDPAFTSIESIAAKRAASNPTETPTHNPIMDLTKFVELKVITAEQAKDPDKAAVLIAEHVAASHSKDKDSAALIKANKEAADAKAEVQAMKEKAANAFVSDAVTAGKIKAKDEDDKNFWRDTYLNDADVATAQMERRPAINADLTKPTEKVAASRANDGEQDDSENESLYHQAKALVRASKAKSIADAVRQIGSDAYNDHRTDLGLGAEAAEMRERATQQLMQAARLSKN
jgi:hypothetical protein